MATGGKTGLLWMRVGGKRERSRTVSAVRWQTDR